MEQLLKNMTDRQLLAQLVMVDISDRKLSRSFADAYASHPWGGVILFAKNIESENQLAELTGELARISAVHSGIPMLIGADHEGGIVSRFSFPSMAPLCGNMALGAAGEPEYARFCGLLCGRDLARLGINTDFAPVMDVNSNPMNPIIGARSFGQSPEKAARLGSAFIDGLRETGVISCAKHFPGHGDVSVDSHFSMPVVNKTPEELESCELIPFAAAVKAGSDMIMTAHISFPQVDPSGLPATLSPVILKSLLRDHLGFEGAVITDSMFMDGIRKYFSYEEAAVKALEAGVDMVMLCGRRQLQISALDEMERALKKGVLHRENLERSFLRLASLRKRAASVAGREKPPLWREKLKEITARSITLITNRGGALPLSPEEKILLVSPERFPPSPQGETVMEPSLPGFLKERAPSAEFFFFNLKKEPEDLQPLAEKARRCDKIVLCAYANGKLTPVQEKIAGLLSRFMEKTVSVSLSSPYIYRELDWSAAHIACYNYGVLSMEALSEVLFGDRPPEGKLPVTISEQYREGFGLTGLREDT